MVGLMSTKLEEFSRLALWKLAATKLKNHQSQRRYKLLRQRPCAKHDLKDIAEVWWCWRQAWVKPGCLRLMRRKWVPGEFCLLRTGRKFFIRQPKHLSAFVPKAVWAFIWVNSGIWLWMCSVLRYKLWEKRPT